MFSGDDIHEEGLLQRERALGNSWAGKGHGVLDTLAQRISFGDTETPRIAERLCSVNGSCGVVVSIRLFGGEVTTRDSSASLFH